jgi:hypothetical protein
MLRSTYFTIMYQLVYLSITNYTAKEKQILDKVAEQLKKFYMPPHHLYAKKKFWEELMIQHGLHRK